MRNVYTECVEAHTIDREKFTTAAIIDRTDLTEDLWLIRIQLEETIPFRSGQYVTIGLDVQGSLIERPYSVCSSPLEDHVIDLFLERVPGGELSVPLHACKPGTELVVRKKAKGLFLKNLPLMHGPLLFVATVTGVAPYVSTLRTMVRERQNGTEAEDRNVLLLHGASHSAELGYAEELNALSESESWFRYVPTLSRPWEHPDWTGETGRVDELLRKYADELSIVPGSGATYLCGHPGMITHAKEILKRKGLNINQIHEEQYWPE